MIHFDADDYGVIGNGISSALVSRLGSIDWLCLPFIDSPSVFAGLVEEKAGGKFQIVPAGDFHSHQRYVRQSNVLETVFETPFGRATLTDWMPMNGYPSMRPVLHRKVEVHEGQMTFLLTLIPRFHYGGYIPLSEHFMNGVLYRGAQLDEILYFRSSQKFEFFSNGAKNNGRFSLEGGQKAVFSLAWGRTELYHLAKDDPEISLKETIQSWRRIAHRCGTNAGEAHEGSSLRCPFLGPWHDSITRSSLTLKLLVPVYSGAIIESVTTSIPRTRNEGEAPEDHRYSWIREGALAIQAFYALGLENEARSYFSWLSEILKRDQADRLQPIYGADGSPVPAETHVGSLQGPNGESQLRIGHKGTQEFHISVYGELLLAILQFRKLFGEIPEELWPGIQDIAEFVCQAWRRPDYGLWNRTQIEAPRTDHFVASKVMAWSALKCANELARVLGQEPPHRWQSEQDILHHTICAQGVDPRRQVFVRTFGGTEIDSSCLLIPLVGFLPIDDIRVQETLSAVSSELSNGVLVRPSQPPETAAITEFPSLESSFLVVLCETLSGRESDASDRLAELCTYSNPLGLFTSTVDPAENKLTGNFPSASAHLYLINAALYLACMRGGSYISAQAASGLMGSPMPRLAKFAKTA